MPGNDGNPKDLWTALAASNQGTEDLRAIPLTTEAELGR